MLSQGWARERPTRVLKLVYHTFVFGEIGLEFQKEFVRVGSSPENDLVLPHPSVRDFHCLLVFSGERVAALPPDAWTGGPACEVLACQASTRGCGDELLIGEVAFKIAHSANTVALPAVPDTEPEEDLNGPRYFCPRCRSIVPGAMITQIGLAKRSKHVLCPKCSAHVESMEDVREGG